MKMMTGLPDPTEGHTRLFGQELAASDMQSRLRIGYMSQTFSLYTELSVRQNLMLHAELYGLPADRRQARVEAVLDAYDLRTEQSQPILHAARPKKTSRPRHFAARLKQ